MLSFHGLLVVALVCLVSMWVTTCLCALCILFGFHSTHTLSLHLGVFHFWKEEACYLLLLLFFLHLLCASLSMLLCVLVAAAAVSSQAGMYVLYFLCLLFSRLFLLALLLLHALHVLLPCLMPFSWHSLWWWLSDRRDSAGWLGLAF